MKRALDWLAITIVVLFVVAMLIGLGALVVALVREVIAHPPVEYAWPATVVATLLTLSWAFNRVSKWIGEDL